MCEYFNTENPWIQGTVVGIVAIIFWEIGKYFFKEAKYSSRYSKYSGNYIVYDKRDQEKGIILSLKLKVRGKKLIIVNCKNEKETTSLISGVITMSDETPNYGNGYYQHEKISEGWGFYEVQLTSDNKIIVNSHYFQGGTMFAHGYIWERK